ncbi:MAG: polyprenyl synthetase family protein [Candidatus Margulisiibacteriota bacterium]
MNSQHSFELHKENIENFLDRLLTTTDTHTHHLIESSRYSVLNGGKRVRGLIAMGMGACLDHTRNFVPLAAGLELIHTYSLIHDDLPAMDNDDFRRGKPSNHKAFGEAMAILTGDYLMPLAYQLFSENLLQEEFLPKNILGMIAFLSHHIGERGMVGGQVMDMDFTRKTIDLSTLEKMHHYKTGLFIEAAFLCPLILVHGTIEKFHPFELGRYTQNVGLLFQIVDDILDETADEGRLGKPKGSDKKQGKATYVELLGLSNAKQKAKHLYEETQVLLQKTAPPDLTKTLQYFLDWIYGRDF